jgi:long-chain acyl-CoA synthetase
MSGMIRDDAFKALTSPGAPYEIVGARDGDGVPIRVFRTAPASLRVLFEEAVSDKPFIVYDDERLTFAEAYESASKIAWLLRTDYGVGKGDRVAISMRNFPEWICAFMAVTSLGAIAVAMNALWRPEELAYGLTDSGACVLFADQERLDRLAQCQAPPTVRVIAVRGARSSWEAPDLTDLLRGVEQHGMPPAEVAPTDAATIFYTSGSTGHPKGVVSSHRAILNALLSWELDAQVGVLTAPEAPPPPANLPATLLAVPLFHVTGSHKVFLESYRAQRRLVCMYKWDPAQAAELIERERITTVTAPAAMTGDLVREAGATKRDLSSLVMVGGGGAPRAPEQVRQIDAVIAAAPATGWGMTETNAIGAGIGGPDYLDRPASSGRASAVLDLKVVDETGATLPANQRGELLIRGGSMFDGYWNRPEINAEVFQDGWFRTGDVAYLDDEGYLFIVDRIKDLIIRGGENIGCGQVEAALLMHPDVREAAVYAIPDERLGEEVGATIHAAPDLDVEALRGFLGQHLASFEVPRYITLHPEPLPRTASGKVLKRELRAEAIAAMAVRASAEAA